MTGHRPDVPVPGGIDDASTRELPVVVPRGHRVRRRRWLIGTLVALVAVLGAGAGIQSSFADEPTYSLTATYSVQYYFDQGGPRFREYYNTRGDVTASGDASPVIGAGEAIGRSATVAPVQSGGGNTGVGGSVPIGGVTIGDLNNLVQQITAPTVPAAQVPGTWEVRYTNADGSAGKYFADLRGDGTALATFGDGTRIAGRWNYSDLGTLNMRYPAGATDAVWKVFLTSTGSGVGNRSAGIYGAVPAGSPDTGLLSQNPTTFTTIKDGAHDNAVAEVVNRVLNQRQAEAQSCLAGAADYVSSLAAQGATLAKQLVSDQLTLVPADKAVGPAVEDAKAFIANPLDYKTAATNPAGWVCGQLVNLAFTVGFEKFGRLDAADRLRTPTTAGVLEDLCDAEAACIVGAGPGAVERVIRQDDAFNEALNVKGVPKSHLDSAGNLVPADPAGTTTPLQHVIGSVPGKDTSPWTSFAVTSGTVAKVYGKEEISLDLGRLEKDIASGALPGVQVIRPEQLAASIKAEIDGIAPVDLNAALANGTSGIPSYVESLKISKTKSKKLAPRLVAYYNTTRDNELLVKGVIPKTYITGPTSTAP